LNKKKLLENTFYTRKKKKIPCISQRNFAKVKILLRPKNAINGSQKKLSVFFNGGEHERKCLLVSKS
jgi:hypothetical protein